SLGAMANALSRSGRISLERPSSAYTRSSPSIAATDAGERASASRYARAAASSSLPSSSVWPRTSALVSSAWAGRACGTNTAAHTTAAHAAPYTTERAAISGRSRIIGRLFGIYPLEVLQHRAPLVGGEPLELAPTRLAIALHRATARLRTCCDRPVVHRGLRF